MNGIPGTPMTRRPIACLPDTEVEQLAHIEQAKAEGIRTFTYREEAHAAAATELPGGWVLRTQYLGYLDRWAIFGKRKSWGYRKAEVVWRTDGSLR
jgi:hypothetical protein